jgi:hypothetical protein
MEAQGERTGSAGWATFAGVMMMLLGLFHGLAALTVIYREDWGWVHLIVGAVVFFAGLRVLVGRRWARTVGIVVASLSALVNLASSSADPLWSGVLIAVDLLAIYALAAHAAPRDSS